MTAPHLEVISDTIARAHKEPVAAIIEVPVRHGKSELISATSPSWFLQRAPHKRCILISHSQDAANEWGQRNRDLIEGNPDLFDVRIRKDSRKVADWRTTLGGGMLSVGANGPITGKGAHFMLVDDPIKNAEQAFSPAYRQHFRRWWQMTIRTRLNRGASVIIIQSRWAEEDLAGWLQEHAAENPLATQWEVIHLPAIAEPTYAETRAPSFDEATWTDSLGRRAGQALWPEMWPLEELERAKADVGKLSFSALYQQRPIDSESSMFPETCWQYCAATEVPRLASIVRKWDLAATIDNGSDPDWTVGALIGRDFNGFTYVLDVVRFRKNPAGTDAMIRAVANRDSIEIPISFDVDPGSAGKRDASYIAREVVPGHTVHFEKPRGKAMARGFAGQAQYGNVILVRASWNTEFVDEFRSFPNGKHDDIVDACSAGFANCVDGIAVTGAVGSSAQVSSN